MMKKHLCLLLTLCLLFACGCGKAEEEQKPEQNGGNGSLTLTDMMGRTVTLKKPAERIVALTAADCEILYALGAGETLVGRGEYCDYPAEVQSVTAVASGYETNVEQIMALQPDLVVVGDMDQRKEQIEQLIGAGIPVLTSNADDIEGVYTSIGNIGRLTGRETEAAGLIASMKETFASVQAAGVGSDGKTVYFEISPLRYGLWTAGSNTFMNEIAGMMGLENCFAEVDGWGEISEEQVILRNPDFIVTVTMYDGSGISPADEICARRGWENVPAVRSGAILCLSENELTRPGPRLAEGARKLFQLVNGTEQ